MRLEDYEKLGEAEFRQLLIERLDSIDSKVNPMYDIFSKVNGFNQISVQIMKTIAMVGVAITGIYVVIEFFKKLGKG